VTDGVTVTSLSASLQHKTSVATVYPCPIALDKKNDHVSSMPNCVKLNINAKIRKVV